VLVHEYDLPGVDQTWSLYRHRLWWKLMPAELRLIVGETGPH
jgi:hypothetical protein